MLEGRFQAIYDSPWHSPVLFWVTGAAFLVVLARARQATFLWRYLSVFTILIVADATVTGALTPLGGSAAMTPVAITFVVLGDLRFFLLLERFGDRAGEAITGARLARVVAISLLVPIASTVAKTLLQPRDPRTTFLIYEAMFLLLALVVRVAWLPRRAASPARRWLERLAEFEIVQYGLWALSDVVILRGVDAGFLMRLVPNTLYYAAFLPFVLATAPRQKAP